MSDASGRLGILKTYKLYIGGAFPRSESGRTYEVTDAHGKFLANAALASRKDARDAVVAARGAFAKWSGATAYNRGQILYRIAEMLEGRRAEFVEEVRDADEVRARTAEKVVDAAIDRWVWYAGWSDKIAQVQGSSNPVAGPFFDFSVPEPTGVVAVIAPQRSSLLGLVSVLAPVIVSGNTTVVVAAERGPIPAISLTEVLATSDLPAGVVNMLTGSAGRARAVAREPHGCERDRSVRSEPRGHRGPRGRRGGEPQARRAPVRARAGLVPGSGSRPHAPVPRDQDRLASDRGMTA